MLALLALSAEALQEHAEEGSLVAPGGDAVGGAGDECPAGCTMVDQVEVHGDPMFVVNGSSRYFWTPAGKVTPLMTWRVDDNDSTKLAALDEPDKTPKELEALRRELVDTSWTLQGTTFDRPDTGSQWFDRLSILREDETVLDVKLLGGKLHVALDGQDVDLEEKQYMLLRSAEKDLEMEMTAKDANHEELEISTGVGLAFKISPSMARNLPDGNRPEQYRHLNIEFSEGLPAGASGLFAELAGVVPMSDATEMLLRRPSGATKASLKCDCHQGRDHSDEGPEHPNLGEQAVSLPADDAEPPLPPVVPGGNLGHMLATGGDLVRSYTCMVDGIEKTCPGTMALAKLNAYHRYLKPKPNEKWLFYGPSYLSQIFHVVMSANREDVVYEGTLEDLIPDVKSRRLAIEADCGGSVMMNRTATALFSRDDEIGLRRKEDDKPCNSPGNSGECNALNNPDCRCRGDLQYPHVKLKNGAEIYAMLNSAIFQDLTRPAVVQLLAKFLNQPGFKIDQVFYMEPHGVEYFTEHCAAGREHRGVDDDKVRSPEGIDMCYGHDSVTVVLDDYPPNEEGVSKEGVQGSATTAAEYIQCIRTKPGFKLLYNHVAKHATQIMAVVPWQVVPSPEFANSPFIYTAFEAGHKYSCVAGAAVAGQGDYGIGSGLCPADEQSTSPFKSAVNSPTWDDYMEAKWRYQSNHPCAVICEAGQGPHACIPGPAARMAIDVVKLARQYAIPGDDESYVGYSDLSSVFAGQMACDPEYRASGVTSAAAAAATAAKNAAAAGAAAPAAGAAAPAASAAAPAAAAAAAPATAQTMPPAVSLSGQQGQNSSSSDDDELLDRITRSTKRLDKQPGSPANAANFSSKGGCAPYCAALTGGLTWSEKCLNDRQCAGCAQCAGVYDVDPS